MSSHLSLCRFGRLFGVALLCLVAACPLRAAPPFEKGDVIAIIGDSLTEHGVKPTGFVTLLGEDLNRRYPSLGLKVIGSGVGWNTMARLRKRFDRDVPVLKPDFVIVLIGDNDVGMGESPERSITKQVFKMGMNDLVWRIRRLKAEPILCTLTVLGEKKGGVNEDDELLDAYSEIIRGVAAEKNCRLIELREPLVKYVEENNPDNKALGIVTRDGAHFNETGDRLVADLILETLIGSSSSTNVTASLPAVSVIDGE